MSDESRKAYQLKFEEELAAEAAAAAAAAAAKNEAQS